MGRKLDRGLSAGGFVAIVSAALLTAGPFAVFPTVAHDDVDLPNGGSLEEILRHALDSCDDYLRVGWLFDWIDGNERWFSLLATLAFPVLLVTGRFLAMREEMVEEGDRG